jgi:uncharacterized coiled-coil protein SlyX
VGRPDKKGLDHVLRPSNVRSARSNYAGIAALRDPNPTGPGFSQMNENASLRMRIPADDSRLRANWRAVHAFNKVKPNESNKKMKTLIRSINRSPLRSVFFTLTIAVCWFALSPPLKAQCPSACGAGGNTAVGLGALDSVTTGINNAALGANALTGDTTGSYNVAVGSGALADNTTGFQNMAIGAGALANNVLGNFNMAIGFRALFMNTGGRNVAVGAAALSNNGNAGDNTAIGSQAMIDNTTSEFNVAVGNLALGSFNGTTAFDGANTALGSIALVAETSGQENVAVGRRALEFMTAGNNNVAVGWRSGDDVSTADNNVFVGSQAGRGTTTGSGNTVVGSNSGLSIGTGTRNVYVGNGVGGFANEIRFIRIGDTSVTDYDCFISGIHDRAVSSAASPHFVIVDANGKLGTFAVPIDAPELKAPASRPDVPETKKQAKLNLKVEKLEATVAQQNKQIETLTAQLKEQAAQIQKVSAQLEVGKLAPKVVANK